MPFFLASWKNLLGVKFDKPTQEDTDIDVQAEESRGESVRSGGRGGRGGGYYEEEYRRQRTSYGERGFSERPAYSERPVVAQEERMTLEAVRESLELLEEMLIALGKGERPSHDEVISSLYSNLKRAHPGVIKLINKKSASSDPNDERVLAALFGVLDKMDVVTSFYENKEKDPSYSPPSHTKEESSEASEGRVIYLRDDDHPKNPKQPIQNQPKPTGGESSGSTSPKRSNDPFLDWLLDFKAPSVSRQQQIQQQFGMTSQPVPASAPPLNNLPNSQPTVQPVSLSSNALLLNTNPLALNCGAVPLNSTNTNNNNHNNPFLNTPSSTPGMYTPSSTSAMYISPSSADSNGNLFHPSTPVINPFAANTNSTTNANINPNSNLGTNNAFAFHNGGNSTSGTSNPFITSQNTAVNSPLYPNPFQQDTSFAGKQNSNNNNNNNNNTFNTNKTSSNNIPMQTFPPQPNSSFSSPPNQFNPTIQSNSSTQTTSSNIQFNWFD